MSRALAADTDVSHHDPIVGAQDAPRRRGLRLAVDGRLEHIHRSDGGCGRGGLAQESPAGFPGLAAAGRLHKILKVKQVTDGFGDC